MKNIEETIAGVKNMQKYEETSEWDVVETNWLLKIQMMDCSRVDLAKKYEKYICESKADDDSMVASDLKQFPYTAAEEDEPGEAEFENSSFILSLEENRNGGFYI